MQNAVDGKRRKISKQHCDIKDIQRTLFRAGKKQTKQNKKQITILYQVLVFLRKQNQIRMKAQKLQVKKSRHFFDIQIHHRNKNVIEK